jgi:prolyl-tRNA synthetase
MRMSRLLLRTLRDAPSDAEAVSHQLLVRAGYIRRVASGVYTFLPLGWRVLRNVERIVREEMDGAGAQEILMPIIQPSELWAQTGRLHTMQDILFTLEGKGGDFVLAPTHEELVTATVAAEVDSYRDLPLNVYQIQFKYRDEARPRFGLLRGREFIMKDAYSFDASQDGMRASYQLMYDAYCRVFDRLGLTYTPVEADAGAIGGDVNHEFMVPSSIGEDHFARCTKGDYAANTDAATTGERSLPEPPDEALEEHHTPDRPGIEMVVEFFADRGLTAAGMLKCLAVADADGNPVVVLVPGDRDVRVPAGMRPFEEADFERHPELVKGYIGPMGLREKGVRVLADHAVRPGGPWVTGANRPDHHVTGATLGRDFTVADWGSYATVADGDPCPRCGAPLELVQSVEAGHTFQLGLTYSAKIPGATFTDEAGARLMPMP